MSYILGIDQGGSKTAAAVFDIDGSIKGASSGPGAYHTVDGIDASRRAFSEAIAKTIASASIAPSQISMVCCGATGFDWPEQEELLHGALSDALFKSGFQLPLPPIYLYNDCVIAMFSAARSDNCAVLCAGTELNAAVSKAGSPPFVLGFYVADRDMGGRALAQRAIRKVFDSELGLCEPTALADLFLQPAGTDSIWELLHLYETSKLPYRIKDRAPEIIRAAADKDAVALTLVSDFAADLAKYVIAAVKKCGMTDCEVETVLTGSLFKPLPLIQAEQSDRNVLTELVISRICGQLPSAKIVAAKFEPVVGAGVIGLKKSGLYLGNESNIDIRLSETAEAFGLLR